MKRLFENTGIRVARTENARAPAECTAVDVWVNKTKVRFLVLDRQRAPYPGELDDLKTVQSRLAAHGCPLLHAPFVTEALGVRLSEAGWSWADDVGNWDLRAPGVLIQRRTSERPPAVTARRGIPSGAGSLKAIRWLISESNDEPINATGIAERIGVTRPRVIQVMTRLGELALTKKIARGRWTVDRQALLDAFMAQYRGPGGTTQYYHSLEPPGQSAIALATGHTRQKTKTPWVVSADVAADLIAPHRRPSHLVVYAVGATPRIPNGWVEAHGPNDANILVRSAADVSVEGFGFTRSLGKTALPLADPTQILWDLHDMGGEDRLEVAEKVRKWVLRHPRTR